VYPSADVGRPAYHFFGVLLPQRRGQASEPARVVRSGTDRRPLRARQWPSPRIPRI